MKRSLCALLCLLLLCGLLAGCSTGEEGPAPTAAPTPAVEKEPYQIGLVQYKEDAALDALREAFMSRLEEWGCDETQVEIDYQNAGGDPARAVEICDGFSSRPVDMIVAIAAPAAQAAISAAADSPVTVVFTGVQNESVLGLDQGRAPESAITGVVSPTPWSSLLDLAQGADARVKTLGFLYNPEEPDSQGELERFTALCQERGLAVTPAAVTAEEGVEQAMKDLCAQADAVFSPADSTVMAKAAEAAAAAKAAQVPWYTGSAAMVQAGALASMGVVARDQGVQAADMAVQLIQGRELSQVPVFTFSESRVCVNQTTLAALEPLTIPAETLQTAFLYP